MALCKKPLSVSQKIDNLRIYFFWHDNHDNNKFSKRNTNLRHFPGIADDTQTTATTVTTKSFIHKPRSFAAPRLHCPVLLQLWNPNNIQHTSPRYWRTETWWASISKAPVPSCWECDQVTRPNKLALCRKPTRWTKQSQHTPPHTKHIYI